VREMYEDIHEATYRVRLKGVKPYRIGRDIHVPRFGDVMKVTMVSDLLFHLLVEGKEYHIDRITPISLTHASSLYPSVTWKGNADMRSKR
jgi:hypothetical protein